MLTRHQPCPFPSIGTLSLATVFEAEGEKYAQSDQTGSYSSSNIKAWSIGGDHWR